MAITFPGSVTTAVDSTDARSITTASHDPSTADMLIAVGTHGADGTYTAETGGISGSVDGDFTLISETTRSGVSADAVVSVWGLMNPSGAQTITFDAGSGTQVNYHLGAVINVQGIDTASVAAATNVTEEVVNDDPSTSSAFASGGTSGNVNLISVGVIGADADGTFSNNASFTSLAEFNSGGGESNNADGSLYIIYKEGVSACTVSWTPSDENAGLNIELVAAATTSADYRGSNRGIMRGVGRGIG